MQNVFPEFLSVQLKERKQEGRGGRSVSRIWPENQAKRGSGGDFTDHANISTIYSKVEILNRNVDVQQRPQFTGHWAVRNDDLRSTRPQVTLFQFSESREEGLQSENFAKLATQRKKVDWLEEALNELAACPELAVDEGMDKPSQLALERTKVLLKTISKYVEDQPDIYPMDECSIAIDFRNPDQMSGILFLVEKDGSGAYFSRTRDFKGQIHVTDAADLLDEGGLEEFKRLGIR